MFIDKTINVLLAITIMAKLCDSLNILMVAPHFGKSHYFVFESIAKELTSKGHNVSVIVNFPITQTEEFRMISIAEYEKTPNSEFLSLDIFSGGRMDLYGRPMFQVQYSQIQCNRLSSSELQEFIKENNTFDVIVSEVFNTNCFYGLSKIYNAPVVGVSTTDLLPWIYQWFGSPENPSYIPNLFMDYADQMTFLQRVENTLMLLYSKLIHKYLIAYQGNEFSKKYLGVDLYEGGDILYNMSLLLTNRHFSFQTPKPLSPNVIEIGGIHLREPKELPKAVRSTVEQSPDGVVFMSMGASLKGSTFPEEQRKMFLEQFSKLNQTVIWKWENKTMEGLPKNVKIEKWVSQMDLLCHANVKLFITHGGLLSTQEAVYCGVPMLILPLTADQHFNAAALQKSGATMTLKLKSVTAEALSKALKMSLGDEFSENAKKLSERFKDRPMSPMDTAIYWIEYVARHKGASFMRPAITDMPFYQYLLLDVIGFLLFISFICVYVIKKIIVNTFSKNSRAKLKVN